jgi:hypothetical protein
MEGKMRHIRQSRNACFAYSLLQLGAVSIEAVREYEALMVRNCPKWDRMAGWTAKHAPWVQVARCKGVALPRGDAVAFPLKGRGIVIMNFYRPRGRKIIGRHAVTYENGRIMDSAEHAALGKARTLQEYAAWRMGNGYRIEIADVYPWPSEEA